VYQNFIGIDIGKETFYVSQVGIEGVLIYGNQKEGFEQFVDRFKEKQANSLIVLETTGGYELGLTHHLQAKGFFVHRANTRKVKNFIRSLGNLGKSDAIDAQGLALYGKERHEQLNLYEAPLNNELLKLLHRREDLNGMLVQEKNRLKAPEQKELIDSFKTMIEAIEGELRGIQDRINKLIQASEEYTEKQAVLETVPGIGKVISVQLMILMPELGRLNRREIASLAGVAPHPNESGKKKGYRYVRGGRCDVKKALFMAAMTAARRKSQLGEYYQKLIAAGKKKMVALVALMRKILVIVNARMRDYYLQVART